MMANTGSVVGSYPIICAFDLHGVIFYRSLSLLLKRFRAHKHKRAVLRYLVNPFFWYSLYRITRITVVTDQVFDLLIEAYPELRDYYDELIGFENCQKPDEALIKLIKQLRALSIPCYVLSNIGPKTFKKLCAEYPWFLELFDGYYVPCPENKYSRKPDPLFYAGFCEYLSQRGIFNKPVVFIDDQERNIAAARSCNFMGIYFRSPRDIYQGLAQYGIRFDLS